MSTDINIVNLINQLKIEIPVRTPDARGNIEQVGESEVCLIEGDGPLRFAVQWNEYVHEVVLRDDRLYYVRPTNDDIVGTTMREAFEVSEAGDNFIELFEVAEDGEVNLLSLALIFAYFGPPSAVTLVTRAMGSRIDALSDALEDCRQECADKVQVRAEGSDPSPSQSETSKAPKSNIKRNIKIALAICGCGLMLGYVFSKFPR